MRREELRHRLAATPVIEEKQNGSKIGKILETGSSKAGLDAQVFSKRPRQTWRMHSSKSSCFKRTEL